MDERANDVLLHITTPPIWRVALAAGSLVTPSLVVPPTGTKGFIHLSRPDQVALPANRIYAGRDDLLLLVIDTARLDADVRWEPGAPIDPDSARFPHLYGPLPVAAVTSVVPWGPGPDGRFVAPTGLPAPTELAARAHRFDASLAARRAPVVVAFDGGFATRDPRVAASHEHNSVWFDRPASADHIRSVADELLAGCDHRRVVLAEPCAELGWVVDEERLMLLPPDAPTPIVRIAVNVVSVTFELMAALWRSSWRRSHPEMSDETIDDLVRREAFADAHVRVVNFAVLDPGGRPVAGAQLRIDGATAAVEAVMTEPDHRGRGLARATVAEAIRLARAAGCDLVWLFAAAADWPRGWYTRLGFLDAGARWVATVQHRTTEA